MIFSGQQLGKYIPMATNMDAIELLLETGYFLCGPCQDVVTAMSSVVSSIQQRAMV
jgi:hypothetical protein